MFYSIDFLMHVNSSDVNWGILVDLEDHILRKDFVTQ